MKFVGLSVLAACGNDPIHHLPDGPGGPGSCQALDVDAMPSDATVATVDILPATGFTWELWFNAAVVPTSTATKIGDGATIMIAADFHQCEDSYIGFGSEQSPANELTFNLDGAGGCAARDLTPLHYLPAAGFVTDHWYFVAATHDYTSGISKLYLDGAMVATKVSTAPAVAYIPNVSFGRWTDRSATNNYNQFHGAIDEAVVLGRVLSDSEITTDFTTETVRAAGAADLLAGYHFDGDLTDFSGHGNDATNEGATFGTGHVGCP